MSEFTTDGHDPYPNLHLDRLKLVEVGAENHEGYIYSTQHLEEQVGFYTRFLGQTSILRHHRTQADRNLDGYIFELAWRDEVYSADINKLEDEICE